MLKVASSVSPKQGPLVWGSAIMLLISAATACVAGHESKGSNPRHQAPSASDTGRVPFQACRIFGADGNLDLGSDLVLQRADNPDDVSEGDRFCGWFADGYQVDVTVTTQASLGHLKLEIYLPGAQPIDIGLTGATAVKLLLEPGYMIQALYRNVRISLIYHGEVSTEIDAAIVSRLSEALQTAAQ